MIGTMVPMSARSTKSAVRGNGTARVSIAAVAREARVSTATVSRVLNSPGVVAEDTARRVQDAIARLDYRPNRFASSLASRRSRVIAVSLPDLHGEFFSQLICSAERHAATLGYDLLISSSTYGPLSNGEATGSVMDIVDGLVTMVSETDHADLEHLSALPVPAVAIVTDRGRNPAGTVAIDQATGTREAVAHLLEGTPPDRCYFVGGHQGNTDSDARSAAFVRALAAAGHTVRPDQVAHGEFALEWGSEWAAQALKKRRLAGAAVLAGNDDIAVGVLDAARDAGLRVPEDLRLVGFDDTRLCTMMRPTLSSVAVPIAEAARAAIAALIGQLDRPEEPARPVRLSTALVVRDSSRPTS